MAVTTYLYKIFRRIGVFIVLIVLTSLATLFFPNIEDEESSSIYATLEPTTNIITNRGDAAKFILLWTDPRKTPFNHFGKGSIIFRSKSCKYTNCYVTADRKELGDVSVFDVVLFNGPQLPQMMTLKDFPASRSVSQKYVYTNIESAQNYPLCHFNGFFNWTWTYRLDSDIDWGYFVVKNRSGHVVAPSMNVAWATNEESISKDLKDKLRHKTKAVAWFATKCHTKSRREHYVKKVKEQLKNYSLTVDVYGPCGTLQCPFFNDEKCLELLKEYSFYFAFENSFSEDYVTEKVLKAYFNNVVPVVYGGANYSRFLPMGSYLDARELGPEKLAATINYLIRNPEAYYTYFTWQKYYSFHLRHESPDTDNFCKFCEALNSEGLSQTSVRWSIKEWWTGNFSCAGELLRH